MYGWPVLRAGLIAEKEVTGRGLDEKQLAAVFTAGAWSVQGGRFVVGRAERVNPENESTARTVQGHSPRTS